MAAIRVGTAIHHDFIPVTI